MILWGRQEDVRKTNMSNGIEEQEHVVLRTEPYFSA